MIMRFTKYDIMMWLISIIALVFSIMVFIQVNKDSDWLDEAHIRLDILIEQKQKDNKNEQ